MLNEGSASLVIVVVFLHSTFNIQHSPFTIQHFAFQDRDSGRTKPSYRIPARVMHRMTSQI